MNPAELLVEGFGRIRKAVHAAADGLSTEELAWRVDSEANSIGWLLWHLTRIQDHYVAEATAAEQIWTSQGGAELFGLPFKPDATGYGQRSEEVAEVRVDSADLLVEYYDAVHDNTIRYLEELSGEDLDRVVDTAWDPPVTLGVRLVSVLNDDIQHAGQAGLLRGVIERSR
jgi:uncharacterized damage-inducible protein DinB